MSAHALAQCIIAGGAKLPSDKVAQHNDTANYFALATSDPTSDSALSANAPASALGVRWGALIY